MTHDAPPRLGRWLLRLLPLGERRADVEDDLMELFESRTASRGARYARRRYFSDVLSLWRGGRRSGRRLARQSEVVRSSRFSPTEVLQDLTYAARMLRRSPAVVLMAIVGLALAISVGTSMFSILNIIAFRSTGIRDSSALVSIMRAYRDRRFVEPCGVPADPRPRPDRQG
jgi:hypothetical protein